MAPSLRFVLESAVLIVAVTAIVLAGAMLNFPMGPQ
jgi:hypothetical protein